MVARATEQGVPLGGGGQGGGARLAVRRVDLSHDGRSVVVVVGVAVRVVDVDEAPLHLRQVLDLVLQQDA